MNKIVTSPSLAVKLWLCSALNLAVGFTIYSFVEDRNPGYFILIISFFAFLIGSIPAFFVLIIFQPLIKKFINTYSNKIAALLFVFFLIAIPYGLVLSFITDDLFNLYSKQIPYPLTVALCVVTVFAATFISFIINLKRIKFFFSSANKNITTMEETSQPFALAKQSSHANKIWVKGIITAVLILLMLIPTVFVSNLVEERQQRQEEVKNEVSSKWAGEQNITFPYLSVPYTNTITLANGKTSIDKRFFVILPENLNVTGSVNTEQRKRSIYSVLLYNSSLEAKGNFNIQFPQDVDTSVINWNESKICLGVSEFKGIQQKITAKINNVYYDFSAGIPTNEIDSVGLSSPIILSADDIGKNISFELPLKIKGSDQLHFLPLAGNSQFNLTSNWNSPSFDGNTLPNERNLNNNGFEASWNFNKANLPFTTVLKNFNFKKDDYAFGVSLLQPTDQYAKTLRCVKYAILFIGLSFSLFFIIEIMQNKPFHPVQYVLVGLALIIFYTLLLSISEFLLFDIAYLIASTATVTLISLYAKSHFKSWKTAGVFAGVIGGIYSFIFVLIRLEDTALLVGSIGLFVILALAMYASRKINWYGNSLINNTTIS
ncbi:MAG: cell envelope integrity protein CreD [Parafilimonas sp.]